MKNEIDGMVYCHEIDKWVTKEKYKDFIAEQLQQKIADLYKLEEFLIKLAKKNGITNY